MAYREADKKAAPRLAPGTLSGLCALPQGQVAEWFKAAVLKTAVGGSSPWVRIPPCPPRHKIKDCF